MIRCNQKDCEYEVDTRCINECPYLIVYSKDMDSQVLYCTSYMGARSGYKETEIADEDGLYPGQYKEDKNG